MFAAGVHDRPYPRVPLLAHQRTAALRDPAVDHGGPNGPLGGIVGRRDCRIEQEPENRVAMLDQPFGRRPRLAKLKGPPRPETCPDDAVGRSSLARHATRLRQQAVTDGVLQEALTGKDGQV